MKNKLLIYIIFCIVAIISFEAGRFYNSLNYGLLCEDKSSFINELSSTVILLENLTLVLKQGMTREEVLKVLKKYNNVLIKYRENKIYINDLILVFRNNKLKHVLYINQDIINQTNSK